MTRGGFSLERDPSKSPMLLSQGDSGLEWTLSHSAHDGGWLLTKVGLAADYLPYPINSHFPWVLGGRLQAEARGPEYACYTDMHHSALLLISELEDLALLPGIFLLSVPAIHPCSLTYHQPILLFLPM